MSNFSLLGSGCIGLSFLGNYINNFQSIKNISVILIDIESKAIDLANENIHTLQLQLKTPFQLDSTVKVFKSDILLHQNLILAEQLSKNSKANIDGMSQFSTSSVNYTNNYLDEMNTGSFNRIDPGFTMNTNHSAIFSNSTDGHEVDVWLCNPPYIQPKDLGALPQSVKRWESMYALNGISQDGIFFHKSVMSYIKKRYYTTLSSSKKWVLILEIDGEHQRSPLMNFIGGLFTSDSIMVSFLSDSAGKTRVLILESKGPSIINGSNYIPQTLFFQ